MSDVINFSVVGYDSTQILRLFLKKIKEAEKLPDLVVIWVGLNDFEGRVAFWTLRKSKKEIRKNFTKKIEKLVNVASEKNIKVILNTLPSLEKIAGFDEQRGIMRFIAEKKDNVYLNDMKKVFEKNNRKELYASIDDSIGIHFHPSALGHTIITDELDLIIRQVLFSKEGE